MFESNANQNPRPRIGYCTNVHGGTTLDQVKANLLEHATKVKSLVVDQPESHLPVGLWLSNSTATELKTPDQISAFGDWLDQHGFLPYTLNGFPFNDFHQPIVKHDVYLPTWAETDRFDYTLRLAEILSGLLPLREKGTISTLPIGWPQGPKNRAANSIDGRFSKTDAVTLRAGANHLIKLAEQLARMYDGSGRLIQVCIEPEPGCLIDCADDIVLFFEELLFCRDEETTEIAKRHLAVCHDVCHSAVMFESQATAVEGYVNAGISIGKIQISSAVEARLPATDLTNSMEWRQLLAFAEPKYLHQTSVVRDESKPAEPLGFEYFFEDLKKAINWQLSEPADGKQTWRVHFHVPIFLEQLDQLHTTQSEIENCLLKIKATNENPHFEIETYAWNVLPKQHHSETLSDGIAKEIRWLNDKFNQTEVHPS